MKAETADYLAKARATLADAQQIAALPLPHIAAREAYLAAFHAAEAYIFEQTGKPAKSHHGVLGELARLAKAEPRIGRDLARFLSTAYQFQTTVRLRHWFQCHPYHPCGSQRRHCIGATLHRHPSLKCCHLV